MKIKLWIVVITVIISAVILKYYISEYNGQSVLKRDMEYAMLDTLVEKCRIQGIKTIYGYYYPTAKNNMVRHLYKDFGFELLSEDETGNTVWSLQTETYEKKNRYIKVN